MEQKKPSRLAKVVWTLVKWALLIAAVLVLFYGLLDLLGAQKEKAVRARWARSLGSLDEFQKGIPETKKNAEAQALEALAAKMGLTQEEEKPPWKGLKSPLYDYVKAELGRPSPEVQAPPEAVASFLVAQSEVIAALRRQLIDGAAPVWEERRTELYAAPIPRLMPLIEIQRLFAADALAALQRGERDRAAQDLEASWKLQDALSHRPELISILVRMALVRFSAGVLRKFDGAPAVWTERLASYQPRADILKGYSYEACAALEVGQPRAAGAALFEGTWMARRLTSRLARPYIRLCAAGSTDLLLDLVETVRDENPCAQDLTDKLAPVTKKVPWWNIVARITVPNLGTSWARVGRIQVDAEFTRKILEARAARDKNGGAWPESLPEIESSVCKGERWVYALTPERLAITFSMDLLAPSAQSFVLPLKYEEPVISPRKGK